MDVKMNSLHVGIPYDGISRHILILMRQVVATSLKIKGGRGFCRQKKRESNKMAGTETKMAGKSNYSVSSISHRRHRRTPQRNESSTMEIDIDTKQPRHHQGFWSSVHNLFHSSQNNNITITMKSTRSLTLWTLALSVVHAGGDIIVSPPSWSSAGVAPASLAFVTTSTSSSSTRIRDDISSISSLFGSKVDRRPDTQRFNNLIYATDDTVQLLREELKSRLLKAADEFNAMDKMNVVETPTTTNLQDQDRGNYVIRLLRKIVRKISRRGLPAPASSDITTKDASTTSTPTLQNQQNQPRTAGGILSSDSFRQAKLEVGELGAKVIEMAEQLSLLNPTPIPTLGFKHYGGALPSESKLGGIWKLRFTTAADASFPNSAKRGVATTSQVIDATEGTLTNVVDFEKGKLKGFRVVVEGEPVSETTMRLSFKKVKILRQSRFPRLFGEITIRLPSRLIRWLGSTRKEEELADDSNLGPYLQLRYLDDNLRMHTTNTGNWFIQTRLEQ